MKVLSSLFFFQLFAEKTTNFYLFPSIKMDFLSDDLIINIAERVAAHSVRGLFSFMRTNKRHANLCRIHDVSKAFGADCIALLTDLCMSHEKLNFMDRLWDDGYPMFCILRCTQHMLDPMPRFDVIERLLTNAEAANSLSVKHFHVLVRDTGMPPINEGKILADFWALLMTRNLSQYRSDILGGDTSFRFRCTWYKRFMPPGMSRRCFCHNWLSCPRDGRRGNYRGFLPADDEEYVFNHFCIRCRLDGKV